MIPALVVTNDFHSAVPEGRGLLAALRQRRADGALVVDAGDFFGGNAFHEFSQGHIEQGLLTELYDALVPGNHDFADLMRLESPETFPPVVCANVRPPQAFTGRWEGGAHRAGRVDDGEGGSPRWSPTPTTPSPPSPTAWTRSWPPTTHGERAWPRATPCSTDVCGAARA
ncbi:metallophosphoesterase [Streptomyces mirabilis]|uniref:metallophosphoesterase n=1 Tax=Streptomyces mirabilis TaxID=68239 RepID=UPI003322B5FF